MLSLSKDIRRPVILLPSKMFIIYNRKNSTFLPHILSQGNDVEEQDKHHRDQLRFNIVKLRKLACLLSKEIGES